MFMYFCEHCEWEGDNPDYCAKGDGHCPDCASAIPGCIAFEKCKRLRLQQREEYWSKVKQYEETKDQ